MTSFVFVAVVVAGSLTMVGTVITYHLIVKRLETIHDLVNSNLTRVKQELEVALTRIDALETLLSQERPSRGS